MLVASTGPSSGGLQTAPRLGWSLDDLGRNGCQPKLEGLGARGGITRLCSKHFEDISVKVMAKDWSQCSGLNIYNIPVVVLCKPCPGWVVINHRTCKKTRSQLMAFILWAIKLNTVTEPMNNTAL